MEPEGIPGWFQRKFTTKQRDLISLIAEGTLLVVLLSVSTYAWNQRHITVKTNTVVVTKTAKASASPTPQVAALGPAETVTIPIDPLAAGYKLSLTVPTLWRTVDIRSEVSLDNYPGYNLGDLAAVLRFVPEHPERSTLYPATEPINRLEVLATSHWAGVSDDTPATAANKQSYLAYLASLKTANDITAGKCTPITFGGSVCADLKVKPQIVKSADGALSGMAFLSMQTQSVSYDPSVIVEMVGSVGGKQVHVSGSFLLYDQSYVTLGGNGAQSNSNTADYVTKVQAARKAYFEGNPPADTVDTYAKVVAAVSSMHFTK